jgi:cysteine desulfurase
MRRYFDWAASAPPDCGNRPPPDVPFGNPSSPHREGKAAKAVLENARERCAAALGVSSGEIFFTSGGTESNALALFSLPARSGPAAREGVAFLASAGEHPSVRENCPALARLGVLCAEIPLDSDGAVSEQKLRAALKQHPGVRMAAIMAVNNETGALNDMENLSRVIGDVSGGTGKVHLHCDAVQAAGKIPLDFSCCDSAAISAHKIGGPRGAGILYARKSFVPLVKGGGQEGGLRPGTENTAGAAALAVCLERRAAGGTAEREGVALRMGALLSRLRNIPRFSPIPSCRENEDPRFSPWILQAAFRGIAGEVMVRALDEEGFAVSTGSACSGAGKRRTVLEAMGVDRETAFSGIRVSQGWTTTMDDIEALAETIARLCQKL